MAQRRKRLNRVKRDAGAAPKKYQLDWNLRPIIWELLDINRDLQDTLKTYRRGSSPRHVFWHDLVEELVEREDLTFPKVWARLRRYAAQHPRHPVVEAVVPDNRACSKFPGRVHSEGLHLHCRNPRTELTVGVSYGAIKNLVSKRRRRST